MTPLDELEEARDRLEVLRDAADLGPWGIDPDDYTSAAGEEMAIVSSSTTSAIGDWMKLESALLIVVLRRTVDIQILMLSDAMNDLSAGYEHPYALDLARAVNGGRQ
jgi:hypothetical protein